MHTFLDESGSFAFSSGGKPSICCVSALTVSERDLQAVLGGFDRIVSGWKLGEAEPKGSQLSERQVDRVLTFLGNFDVVVNIASIDMGQHTESDIEAHKRGQAQKIRTSTQGPEYKDSKESLHRSVRELADRVEAVSNPLYVQSVLLTQAIGRAFRSGELHYAQTQPKALGSFTWRLDAKDTKRTAYEQTWADIVKPILQTISLRGDHVVVTEFDYSAMAPFERPELTEPPAHLVKGMPRGARGGHFRSVDLRKIFADLAFEDSHGNRGLQLADILGNAFKRALSGNLGERGWRRFGRLLVQDFRGESVIYVTLRPPSGPVPTIANLPYAEVARRFCSEARHWEV